MIPTVVADLAKILCSLANGTSEAWEEYITMAGQLILALDAESYRLISSEECAKYGVPW